MLHARLPQRYSILRIPGQSISNPSDRCVSGLAASWSRKSRIYSLVLAWLTLPAGLLACATSRKSSGWDEPGHLVAGLKHWQTGTFEMYRVNPPLVRMAATVPVLLANPSTNATSCYEFRSGSRPELAARAEFIAANGGRVIYFHTLARWACIPFSLFGGCICFCWARELFGDAAGVLALAFWSLSPNVIAHAQMITPDAGAATLGLSAAYAFWRWLAQPTWRRAVLAGCALGLAELTKTIWITLFMLWPALWFAWRWLRLKGEGHGHDRSSSRTGDACQLGIILLAALYLINLGYGFEGTFTKLGDYRFVSETLGGAVNREKTRPYGGNRFEASWLAALPVPLPEDYVLGIDLQKRDFERKMLSYLRGEWRMGGWWYYYLYALAVKVPLGTWTLASLALVLSLFGRDYCVGWRAELVLLAPIVVTLALVSSQTGFNHHLRYALPVFPFLFVWLSRVARIVHSGHRKAKGLVVAAAIWSFGSSLWIYPHSLSYFNELGGGPTGGHAHLGCVDIDSNIDWGQDLLYLKRWLDTHPEASPLHLSFSAPYDASIVGIDYALPPTDPQPGWHALSLNRVFGPAHEYTYFQKFKPLAMAGYSIYVYHILPDEANRIRRELGLPELSSTLPLREQQTNN